MLSVCHVYLDHVYLNSCLYIIGCVESRRNNNCVCVLSLSPYCFSHDDSEIWKLFTAQSLLRQVHSLFQSEFSRLRASASFFKFQNLLFLLRSFVFFFALHYDLDYSLKARRNLYCIYHRFGHQKVCILITDSRASYNL
jgi:hypothetical protein